MTPHQQLAELLQQGENTHLEFKRAAGGLPRNALDTVAAFLNREGGTLLFGVADDGTVEGLSPETATQLCKDLVALANNPNNLQPIHRLFPEIVAFEGRTLVRVDVPQSSQVHTVARVVYDRSVDGDFRVTDQAALQTMYGRKSSFFTENTVYPYMELADLRPDLFTRVRQMAALRDSQHPWQTLSDPQLLQSAGLWRRDWQTGQQGYTLAAALLFGKDETIRNVLPHYDIDALVRRVNTDRYDDRDYIACNLLDAYNRLMQFVNRHLPDPFFLEGTQRVSLRDKIFREVVVNLLVHREYSSAYIARLVIEPAEVVLENANRAYRSGPIDPGQFTPHPKNPNIANVFREIGLMDRLGSGVRNVTRYIQSYAGRPAQFVESDVFRTVVPVPVYQPELIKPEKEGNVPVNVPVNVPANVLINFPVPVNEAAQKRLLLILEGMTAGTDIRPKQWAEKLGVAEKTVKRDFSLLREAGWIQYVGALKNGRYVLTEAGKRLFSNAI